MPDLLCYFHVYFYTEPVSVKDNLYLENSRCCTEEK